MVTYSSELPTELWNHIVKEVAIPTRTALFHLLFVSRRFHDIVIPILYEDISQETRSGRESHHVLSSLEASTHLAVTKQFTLLATNLPSSSLTLAIPNILSSMENLQRLRLAIHRPPASLFQPLRANSLTHFSFTGYPPSHVFQQILIAQPSLEYLKLGFCPEISIPADALPSLRTLIIDVGSWNLFVTGRRIQHLDGSFLLSPGYLSLQLPDMRILGSIVSLRLEIIDVKCLPKVIPYLKNIAYFRATLCETYPVLESSRLDITELLDIPSTRLRYCNFGVSTLKSPEDVTLMFDKYPDLVVVDVSDGSQPLEVIRYVRGAGSPVQVCLPPLRQWEQWWENVDLGDRSKGGSRRWKHDDDSHDL
ncbi:hypothetical protein ONZ45_g12421 [Pleurotus djamor]|nr:hypothetical protein ONZ45_g12421 [Pleurotus djamor]